MKKCPSCGLEFDTDKFYKHPRTKDKLQTACKKCMKEYGKKYYASKKEIVELYRKLTQEKVVEPNE